METGIEIEIEIETGVGVETKADWDMRECSSQSGTGRQA